MNIIDAVLVYSASLSTSIDATRFLLASRTNTCERLGAYNTSELRKPGRDPDNLGSARPMSGQLGCIHPRDVITRVSHPGWAVIGPQACGLVRS